MLNKTEKWISYFVLAIIIGFAIAFLAKQVSLTIHLKDSLIQAKNAALSSGDLNRITHLHQSSAKVFFLSFFSFAIMTIGILIVIKNISRAYDIAEVKERVRYYLKSASPGIVMIILGAFLLAFCSYRHSNIEAVYSSRLIDFNNFKIASQRFIPLKDHPVFIDSSMLPQPKDSAKTVVVNKPDKSEKKKSPSHKKEIIKQEHRAIAKKSSTKKTSNPVASKPGRAVKPTIVKEKDDHTPISASDIIWSKQFEKNVTVYGYIPTNSEEKRYRRIYKQQGETTDGELHWAYNFLEKTKRGYEPKPGELKQYEMIIEDNIINSGQSLKRKDF